MLNSEAASLLKSVHVPLHTEVIGGTFSYIPSKLYDCARQHSGAKVRRACDTLL